ncbi:MAG: hypothetical protein RSC49_03495 [Clostridium sp.]
MNDITKFKAQDFTKEFPNMVQSLDQTRGGSDTAKPMDISFEEMVTGKWGITQNELFEKIGINPKVDTMQNIFSMPDQSVRWVVPEIIRSAVLLGVREAPFYPNIIASDQSINGLQAIMPYINMSDAAPSKLNEAETIPLGTISYGQKSVNLFKIGKGIKITDEVKNYVSLDVLAIYLRDFGIQLGYAMDTLAIDCAINGNKSDGSESAPVIGVKDTSKGIQYRDLLKIWIRASRLGRNFNNMIGGEDQALDILDLPEFKTRQSGTTQATLNVKTPVPTSADFFIHPGIPDNQLLMVDKRAAMIKLTAKQLMLESERIVSNQTEAVYASLTTGFSKMYQDASLLLASNKDFASNGFPNYMNIDPYLSISLQ